MTAEESIVWFIWLIAGIVWEIRGYFRKTAGDMLTEFNRNWILHTKIGSMTVGAFLVWLVWHWLFMETGFNPVDIAAAILGAALGLVGWYHRFGDSSFNN